MEENKLREKKKSVKQANSVTESEKEYAFFTGDILTCPSKKNTGVSDKIIKAEFHLAACLVLCTLPHCHGSLGHFSRTGQLMFYV